MSCAKTINVMFAIYCKSFYNIQSCNFSGVEDTLFNCVFHAWKHTIKLMINIPEINVSLCVSDLLFSCQHLYTQFDWAIKLSIQMLTTDVDNISYVRWPKRTLPPRPGRVWAALQPPRPRIKADAAIASQL